MTLFDSDTQAFILRIWFEPRELSGFGREWRGVIEHVPTGQRHYFRRLEEIPALIHPYLSLPGQSKRKEHWFTAWWKWLVNLSHKKQD